jgi:hypothetical protein
MYPPDGAGCRRTSGPLTHVRVVGDRCGDLRE